MSDFAYHFMLAVGGLVAAIVLRNERVMAFVMLPLSATGTFIGCAMEYGLVTTCREIRSGEIKFSACGRAAFRKPNTDTR